MWQELSISYAINSPKTEELAADLFYAIAKRDYILSFGVDIQNFEKNPKKAEKQSSTLLKTFGGDVSVKVPFILMRDGPEISEAEVEQPANNKPAVEECAERTNEEPSEITEPSESAEPSEQAENLENSEAF